MKREQFELSKLKIESSGKTTISYKKTITDGSASYAEDIEMTSPRTPHPDMYAAVNALQKPLAEANDLFVHRDDSAISPSNREKLENDKIFQRILGLWDKKVLDSVEVSGLSVQGDLETGSCVITGKHSVHGTAVAMNSPRISFEGNTFKIETEVRNLMKAIHEECYLYIFEGKAAQQEIPFDNTQEEVEEEEEEAVEA